MKIGFHSWSELDPAMANSAVCWPNEMPLACEFRLHNPSFALIRLGTNDAGHPESLHSSLTTIVQACYERGVIPVLGTKADRAEGPEDINNRIIRQVAAQNNIPVWDWDRVARTIPDTVLGSDHIHLTVFYPLDYRQAEAYQRGHSLDNLAALMVLDKLWREIAQAPK